jgi:hypothetical protein
MDGIGSGSCPMAGFSISSVEISGSVSSMLFRPLELPNGYFWTYPVRLSNDSSD